MKYSESRRSTRPYAVPYRQEYRPAARSPRRTSAARRKQQIKRRRRRAWLTAGVFLLLVAFAMAMSTAVLLGRIRVPFFETLSFSAMFPQQKVVLSAQEKPVIPSNETPATDVTKPEIPPTDGTAGNEEDPEMAQNGDCAAGATTPDEQKAYDYTMPVPESAAVDTSYFDDAVFIGDSRTEGFLLNTGLANTTGYCYKGLTVDTAFTNPVISKDGDKVSVMDALRTTNFSKVYIMLGINEAGWIYSDLFIQKYGQIIDEIRNINPDAQIYVQSILPVSQEVSEHHSYLTKTKIDEYNALLQQMAADKSVYYVNCKESVENEDGFLPAESAVDGIHLKRDACNVWLDYLLTHTVPVE